MCNLKENLIRYTSYYKSPDDIENFRIRIRLKEETIDANDDEEEKWHIKEFIWQEKLFNKNEREYYSNINNCLTELEKTYHEEIVNSESPKESIFFTYINQDYYNSEEAETNSGQTSLEKLMESVNLSQEYNDIQDTYDFEKSVQNAMKNKVISSEVENMFIAADLGEYIEDMWIKNEIILCTIRFDKVSKTISIFPDFTTMKPYILKIQGQSLRYVHYFLENSSSEMPEEEANKEMEIFKNISEKKNSLLRENLGEFFLPPKNKLFVYFFFDILSAQGFEYNDLFMQYFIDLPEHWHCENPENLNGITSICHSKGENGLVHYGHNFDVLLEYDIQSLQDSKTPKSPCIYFQLVSKSSWERYRTEGITYQNLPISRPGAYVYDLSCFRFESNSCSGRLRRHFIGDAYNFKDVRWIGLPDDQCENGTFNKFGVHTVGTGQIKFRLNVLHQSQAFLKEFNEGDVQGKFIYEKLNASSLIRSVNQVLKAFKKARRKMYEVKKYL